MCLRLQQAAPPVLRILLLWPQRTSPLSKNTCDLENYLTMRKDLDRIRKIQGIGMVGKTSCSQARSDVNTTSEITFFS